MPSYYGNANYRKKFNAFQIVHESGYEPLKEAIGCAVELRKATELISKALELPELKPETRAQLTLALARCKPDEFHAWIKIAEFLYSKPKHVHIEGNLTLNTENLAERIREGRERIRNLRVVGGS
jgi:hypothetical protein